MLQSHVQTLPTVSTSSVNLCINQQMFIEKLSNVSYGIYKVPNLLVFSTPLPPRLNSLAIPIVIGVATLMTDILPQAMPFFLALPWFLG